MEPHDPLGNSLQYAHLQRHVRNVTLDLVLTVCLCGLWNAVVQSAQMDALNSLLKTEKYAFWKLVVFSLLTCGLYMIYNEYCKARDLALLTGKDQTSEEILAVVLSFIGFHWVYDAIFQDKLNEHIKKISS